MMKNMMEAVKLNKISGVEGHVAIEFVDRLTGKIKERTEESNLCFNESFDTTNWVDFLNQTAYDSLFITDDDTPPDASFPYLRGNIIGVGRNGYAGTGLYGSFMAGDSYSDKDVDDGRGREWKYSYKFTEMDDKKLGSIGLTQQYLNSFTTTTPLSPTRRRKFTAPTRHYAYKGERGICATSNINVVKYFPFKNIEQNITVSGVTAGTYYATGYNADDERAYIYVYSSTPSLRAMYEFADDTFTTLLNTYSMSNYPSMNLYGAAAFAVKSGKAWYYYNGWKTTDFTTNGGETTVTSPACLYNATLYNSYAYSVLVKDNKLFGFRDIYTPGARIPIIDLETGVQIGTMGTSLRPSGTSVYYTSAVIDPVADNNQILLGYATNSPANAFGLKQALTCYTVPPELANPPYGSSVVVKYRVVVRY